MIEEAKAAENEKTEKDIKVEDGEQDVEKPKEKETTAKDKTGDKEWKRNGMRTCVHEVYIADSPLR